MARTAEVTPEVRLTAEQQRVVGLAPETRALITANTGTGKTQF